jgi:hypothetical protein
VQRVSSERFEDAGSRFPLSSEYEAFSSSGGSSAFPVVVNLRDSDLISDGHGDASIGTSTRAGSSLPRRANSDHHQTMPLERSRPLVSTPA